MARLSAATRLWLRLCVLAGELTWERPRVLRTMFLPNRWHWAARGRRLKKAGRARNGVSELRARRSSQIGSAPTAEAKSYAAAKMHEVLRLARMRVLFDDSVIRARFD